MGGKAGCIEEGQRQKRRQRSSLLLGGGGREESVNFFAELAFVPSRRYEDWDKDSARGCYEE